MAEKFTGLNRVVKRLGKPGFGRRPAASPGLTVERRTTKRGQFAAAIEKVRAKKRAAETRAKRPPMPRGLMAASIERKIEKLRKKEKWSFRERHGKTDFYAYLEAVYQVRDWHDSRESKRWSRKVAALYKIDIRKNTHFIRIIIDASCDQDRQVKSRWTQCLEYALAKKVSKSGFIEFLEESGGPAGCAAKMAKLRKMRNRS
jgi:hypothetical protein